MMTNKVKLRGAVSGNLTISEFEPNKKRAYFALVVPDTFINSQGKKVQTTGRFNTVAWGELAELIENNVRVKDEVLLEGKLSNNNYKGRDGIWVNDYQVIISKISVVKERT